MAEKIGRMDKDVLIAMAKELGIELIAADFEKPAGDLNDEELDDVVGGALYGSSGYMITTLLNSCSNWKCEFCGTYSGKADCYDHPKEGFRWCKDCKYFNHRTYPREYLYYRK